MPFKNNIHAIVDKVVDIALGYWDEGYDSEGFNRQGYDKKGFNHFGLDSDGFDRQGFNRQGFDRNGYNRDGYNREGFDCDGYNASGFDRDGYNHDGYNLFGYNRDGYNYEGFDCNGYDKDGFNKQGLDKDGYDRMGYHHLTGLDREGFDKDGFNEAGFDRSGLWRGLNTYDNEGFDCDGYDEDGYDRRGYDSDGYNRKGLDIRGFTKEGRDSEGLTIHCVSAFGVDPVFYYHATPALRDIFHDINNYFTCDCIKDIYSSAFLLSIELAQTASINYAIFSQHYYGMDDMRRGYETRSLAFDAYRKVEEFVSYSNTLCGTKLDPYDYHEGYSGLCLSEKERIELAEDAQYIRSVFARDLFDPAFFLRVVYIDREKQRAYVVVDNLITLGIAFENDRPLFCDAFVDSPVEKWLNSKFVALLPQSLRRRIISSDRKEVFLPTMRHIDNYFGNEKERTASFLGEKRMWWVAEGQAIGLDGHTTWHDALPMSISMTCNWLGIRPAFWIEI